MLLQIYLVKGGLAICEQVAHLVYNFHASSFDAKLQESMTWVNGPWAQRLLGGY